MASTGKFCRSSSRKRVSPSWITLSDSFVLTIAKLGAGHRLWRRRLPRPPFAHDFDRANPLCTLSQSANYLPTIRLSFVRRQKRIQGRRSPPTEWLRETETRGSRRKSTPLRSWLGKGLQVATEGSYWRVGMRKSGLKGVSMPRYERNPASTAKRLEMSKIDT